MEAALGWQQRSIFEFVCNAAKKLTLATTNNSRIFFILFHRMFRVSVHVHEIATYKPSAHRSS